MSRSTLPARFGILPQDCVATLVVGEKGIQTCAITEQTTGMVLFEGDQAVSILQRYSTLEWRLLPPDAVVPPVPPPPEQMEPGERGPAGVPSRRITLTTEQMQTLSVVQKHVFALVNGRHTIDHIARLLGKDPAEVYAVLLELHTQSLIDI